VRATVSLLTLAFFAPVAAGCISNEYVIPPEELNRLVMTPPEVRGQQVHVIQELGSRRAEPVPTEGAGWQQEAAPWPQPAVAQDGPPPEETRDTDVELDLQGNVDIDIGPDASAPAAGRPARGGSPGWRGAPRPGGSTTSSGGGWTGHAQPSGGGVTWHGSPPSPGGGWHGTPAAGSGGGSSGGGGSWLGGGSGAGGGGSNGGDAMIVVAVVLAAVAVVLGLSLVSSEGVRYDGLAEMSPWQPVHLKQAAGDDLVIALGDLSPVALAGTVEAKVMDDEGYGIRRLGHLPISRVWMPTFKLDGGSMTFGRGGGGGALSGFIANMQFGVFVRPWLGLLLTAGVGGAGDEYGATLTRHNFGFEVQSLPIALGPVRVGGFGNVGAAAFASTASGSSIEWGREIGGGLLTELELTGRLALTFRAGANEAFFANSGASPAATFTGGIAIY
jgi:hypothetical protein